MSEELKDFLNFCKTEKLNYAKKYNEKIILVRTDAPNDRKFIIANGLTYDQYCVFEKIYLLTQFKALNPIYYEVILQSNFQ